MKMAEFSGLGELHRSVEVVEGRLVVRYNRWWQAP